MKYMIMMFAGTGMSMEGRSAEWIRDFQDSMMKLDTALREAGEVLEGRKLIDPSQATTVQFRNGAPVPTDGPFAETKESLAGYWIVEATEERAVEIASQVVTLTEYPMEVRRVMDEAAEM
ncbi:YciI family protein [Flindersiella endophytica]